MKCIWIARNFDGTLDIYTSKPIRTKCCFEELDPSCWLDHLDHLDDDMYPELTWENSPKELFIKDLL